jgi:hypothetical protein
MIRKATIEILKDYAFEDAGELIDWKPGQLEIIDCILHRKSPDGKKRIQIIAATRYGKSLAVAAGVVIRASLKPEKWAIVAGTKEKARIIMEYITMFSLDCPIIRAQLEIETPLDRLKMKRSQDRLNYRRGGEVRVFSADSRRITDTSNSLMGFGAPNVVGDESALIPNILQATLMRMLGDKPDNFLVKIGNPFHRNHFLRTWRSDRYYKVLIDYKQGIREGRFSKEFIAEMREEALFDILYECKFPEAGAIDSKGWSLLLTDKDIERAFVTDEVPFAEKRLGCDVAGGGRNYSGIVLRAYNVAKKIYKENEPDTMKFAGVIVRFAKELKIKDNDISIDRVGVGKGAYDRLKEMKNKVRGISGGTSPTNKLRFTNLRAEMYWRAREWILQGGKLEKDDDWYQLADIKYKVADSSAKLKIMSKQEMLREGIDSPDIADAFSMTFAKADIPPAYKEQQQEVVEEEVNPDPYDLP